MASNHSSAIGFLLSLAIVVLTSVAGRIYVDTAKLQIAEASTVQSAEIACR